MQIPQKYLPGGTDTAQKGDDTTQKISEKIEELSRVEKSVEKPKEIDEPEDIKKIRVGNAFDKTGGSSLSGISMIDKSRTQRSLDSLLGEQKRLQSEYDDLPMPKGDNKIKQKRARVRKKIKDLQVQIDMYQRADKLKEPIYSEDVEKFENLARQISYKTKNMRIMDAIQFQIEKKNILDKADRIYGQQAKIITDYLLMVSHVTDGYKSIAGYSINLSRSRKNIEFQVKKCLIHEGMKGNDVSSFISNPYIGLGFALGFPLIAQYQYNKGYIAENFRDSHNKSGSSASNNNKKGAVKVEIGKKNR